MKVAFGYTVKEDDAFIAIADEASRISSRAMQPGKWLVDYYPLCVYTLNPIDLLRLMIVSFFCSAVCAILFPWGWMEETRPALEREIAAPI